MAKIVIDARKIDSTTGRVVEELLKNLDELDRTNEYKVLVLKKEKDYFKPKNPNIEIIVADFPHYTFAEQLGLARLLYSLKPDLVFYNMPQQPLLYMGRAVTFVHDLNLLRVKENDMGKLELFIKKLIFAVLLWLVAKRSKQIVVPTQYTKDDLVKFAGIKPGKVTVSSEGMIDIGKLEPAPEFDKQPFLVYLGRAEPYKNNRGLIQAQQKLLAKYPKLHLVIIGPMDVLREADVKWVKEHGYKNVIFTGWITDEKAAWLYRRAEAYVHPSFMEGFGLPPLEAMQQGAPVVSSNATCSPEVYGEAAHYFDPANVDDMTRAIDDVLASKKLREQLVKKGYQQIKKYSWPKASAKIYNVIKSSLK